MTAMPRRWRKPCGVLAVVIETSSAPPSALELAPGLYLIGRIYHGRTGAAAEGGHITIDYRGPRCGCGKLGCIEALASGPAIARRASEKIAAGRHSNLLELAGGRLDRITSEMVGGAYVTGDCWPKKS